ncbi:MAG: outer membrane beta-barrel protein, partial [Bacteroidia bacterium]
NLFNGNRRITLLGMSNNINQQNFSAQDLFGGAGNRGGGQRPPGMGGGGMGRPGGPGGAMSAMQSTLNNFMVGQQNGINITNSAGFNYINKWGKKVDVSGSYFFNEGENQTDKNLTKTFLLGGENKQVYSEISASNTQNYNHRFNLRLEYNIDTNNSILYTPKFSLQQNKSLSSTIGKTSFGSNEISETRSFYDNLNEGFSLNNNILYKRKFQKTGRTISLNLGYDISDKTAQNYQSSINTSIDTFTAANNINQYSKQKTFNSNANANLTYTEPLGKNGQLLLSYAPSYVINESDKQTNQYDSINSEYQIKDTILSNKFINTVSTHRSSINYNLKGEKYNFMVGLTHQYLVLDNVQEYPANRSFNKPFTNFLPNAMFQYEFNKNKSIRTFYRTATNVPSVSQLQNVLDNSNPLILSIGNPNLKQEFSNFLMFRYSNNMAEKGKSLFLFGMLNLTNNYIASTTSIARTDTTINDVFLSRGTQLSRPENLDGNYSIRTFLTYATPFKKLKSNLNINAGLSYTKVPGMINGKLNNAQTINLNSGFVLGSNISPKVDFNINYTANVNWVQNTLQNTGNNNFLVQNAGAKINLMPNASWVFNSDITYSNYYGLGEAFNQEFYLWNAAIAYKFLNKKVGEIRLSVFDLLNQNNSINRSVTETYIEDTRTRVLNRYFMFTFTYNIRQFKMNEAPKQ